MEMQPYVTVCVAFLHENRFGISLDLKLPRNLDIGFSTVAPCFLWSPSLKHEICKWHLQIESTWRVYIKLAMSLWNVRNCRWPQQLLHYWQSALLREICLPSIKGSRLRWHWHRLQQLHFRNLQIRQLCVTTGVATQLAESHRWRPALLGLGKGGSWVCWLTHWFAIDFLDLSLYYPLIQFLYKIIWVDPGLNWIF